jgi:hypothetical protein
MFMAAIAGIAGKPAPTKNTAIYAVLQRFTQYQQQNPGSIFYQNSE